MAGFVARPLANDIWHESVRVHSFGFLVTVALR